MNSSIGAGLKAE